MTSSTKRARTASLWTDNGGSYRAEAATSHRSTAESTTRSPPHGGPSSGSGDGNSVVVNRVEHVASSRDSSGEGRRRGRIEGNSNSGGVGNAANATLLRRDAGQRDLGAAARPLGDDRVPCRVEGRREGAQGRREGLERGLDGAAGACSSAGDHSSAGMPWMRPPAWLYLPGQGILGGGVIDVSERTKADLQGNVDGPPQDNGDGRIRGRIPPGRVGLESGGADGRGGREDAEPSARCAIASGKASKRGKRQLAADRYASIRRSLDDHAERVAAKKLRTSEASEGHPVSAATRLAALRARVRAKAEAIDSTAPEKNADARLGAPGSGEPDTGAASSRRNELLNMHFTIGTAATGIQSDPACGASSKDAEGDQRCDTVAEGAHVLTACEGRPCTSSDTANEASRVAWHAVEPEVNQPQ